MSILRIQKPMTSIKRMGSSLAVAAVAFSMVNLTLVPQASADGGRKLKNARYCTQGAVATVNIRDSYTSVSISGQYPDERGVGYRASDGFSGEGFSIAAIGKRKIRVTQYQYGADRTFQRC